MCLNRAGTLKGCNTSETLDLQDTHISPVHSLHCHVWETVRQGRLHPSRKPCELHHLLGANYEYYFHHCVTLFYWSASQVITHVTSFAVQLCLICQSNCMLLGNSEPSLTDLFYIISLTEECLPSTDLIQSFLSWVHDLAQEAPAPQSEVHFVLERYKSSSVLTAL